MLVSSAVLLIAAMGCNCAVAPQGASGDTARTRKELLALYARNAGAFERQDVGAIMALRAPDFHTIQPDGTTRDRAAMENYTVGFLNGVKKWNRQTVTI